MWDPLYNLTFEIQYLGDPKKPSDKKFTVPSKAGYLFMNRAAVDEDDQCEILKIFELEKTSMDMNDRYNEVFEDQRKQKGTLSLYQHYES